MIVLHTVLLSFNWLGKLIGGNPRITILISLILSGSCLIGLMEFTQENRADKLWTPENSLALKHKSWVDRNFPTEMRASIVLLVTGDVLTPAVLKEVSWYLWSSTTTFRAVQSILFFFNERSLTPYSAILFPVFRWDSYRKCWLLKFLCYPGPIFFKHDLKFLINYV